MHVVGIVLAAGAGRRYGGPKALARLPDGTSFLTRAVLALHTGGCDPVFVVLGAGADEAMELAAGAELVHNPDWASGMGSSLVAGLTAARSTAGVAALVMLVDTPGIGSVAVGRLAEVATPHVVAVGTYAGRRGHPVLLGRAHWPAVEASALGDAGAREFLRTHPKVLEVEVGDVATPEDIDTPADIDTPEDLPRLG